jgi:putative restriction endonuclease
MNPLQQALLEKIANDNGFEHLLAATDETITLASARHKAVVGVAPRGDQFTVQIESPPASMQAELLRSFPLPGADDSADNTFVVATEMALAALLRRIAGLARALPNAAVHAYAQAVSDEISALPATLRGTEVERLVRQRVGQQKFREAMLDYWGGACAVTGIALPAVLRASHATPWAECATDAERLDVFNGFLLCANLDALFDKFLISFDSAGKIMLSETLTAEDRAALGLTSEHKLRWLAPAHEIYLNDHRSRLRDAA